MSEIEARFRVSLEGKEELSNFFRQSLGEVKQFEVEHGRAMANVNRALSQTGQEFLRFGATAARTLQSISGLNFGIAAQARSVLEFRDSINRLATAANLAENQIGGLKDQVLDISVATGQMKESVTDALGAFVAKTGDIETARKNLELYARTATGTGAALSEVSLIGAELSQKLGIRDQRSALGILAKQGDVGAIEFKDLATQGPRLFAAAAGAGLRGEAGVREIGGLAQLFAEGVGGSGSAARVATSVEGLLRDVAKKAGRSRIEGLGIEVGDRDAIEITKDVIRKFGGNDRALQNAGIFTAASFRGVQTLSRDFREHGGKFTELDKFTNAGGDVSVIDNKFARNSKSGLWALNKTQAEIDRSTDKNLGDTTEDLARRSGGVASVYDWVTAHPGASLAGGAAALFGRNLLSNFAGGGSGGSGLGGILGGGGSRVFVTNWPSGGGGLGGLGDAAAGASKQLSTFRLAAQNAGLLLGTLAAGLYAGHYLDKKYNVSSNLADTATAVVNPDLINNDVKGVAMKGAVYAMFKAFARGGTTDAIAEESASVQKLLASKVTAGILSGKRGGQEGYNAELVEMKPTINIAIHGDTATVETDGTRHPDVVVRRGGAR